ncbi:MAG: COX15/CtaA family protein [Calditrichaeota bacterium]|nr:COX15/CtaA family protein [Calditrichota bacterium]
MKSSKNIIITWLILVALTVTIQILLGGYVRLTRSGLSMYDWHVVHGIIPPLTEESWQETFENYKQTPEYKHINVGMTLDEYKLIYFREYNHRILGRLTGLIFVVPFFIFLFTKIIPFRKSYLYMLIGLLFAAQGVLGWYMVKSGLVDQPYVSHYRLAAHLLMAFMILALVVWKIMDNLTTFQQLTFTLIKSKSFRWSLVFFIILGLQITYGAFVAGLKAGHVSNTFPLMFGYLLPPNLFSSDMPVMLNLFQNSVTVHFIHRWLAFFVFLFSIMAYLDLKKKKIGKAIFLPILVALQIILGLTVIWMNVPVSVALIHQGGAVLVFSAFIMLLHRRAAIDTNA